MPSSPTFDLPTIDDVEAAARTLDGVAVRTPLLESPLLNDCLGGRLLVKAEPLQRTGSFKFRGAYNRLSRIIGTPAGGVVAYSSGNHAQGVAAAACMLGIPACIVMPADAPHAKLDGTRAWGAEVVPYDRDRDSREAIAAGIVAARRAMLVKPFDDPLIIAGQGTVGLELADQAQVAGAALDAVLVPCSGGGLSAGIALALAARMPDVAVYAVEPEGFDDTARSLAAGRRVANAPGGRSICDALLIPEPGEITFAINHDRLAGGLAVSDADVVTAVRVAFQQFKVVVEPGGSVALAAVLSGRYDIAGKTAAVVLSGGNVDARTFAALVMEPAR